MIFIVSLFLPFGANIWNVSTGNGFIIPTESSLFTFKATTMNEGSGEWWIYGEDEKFYYHFIGDKKRAYMKVSKEKSMKCKGFHANDFKTWCTI